MPLYLLSTVHRPMSDIAIRVANLAKLYHLGREQGDTGSNVQLGKTVIFGSLGF